jgi:hypothetical protein
MLKEKKSLAQIKKAAKVPKTAVLSTCRSY